MLSNAQLKIMEISKQNDIIFKQLNEYVHNKFDSLFIMDTLVNSSKQNIIFTKMIIGIYSFSIAKNKDHIDFTCKCENDNIIIAFNLAFNRIESFWNNRASTRLAPREMTDINKIYLFIDIYHEFIIDKYYKLENIL